MARWVEAHHGPVPVADVCASFQEAVVDVLTRKAVAACTEHGVEHLLIGGGVAANSRLRALAQERCDAHGISLRVPRPGVCTDNGAMVAALGSRLVAAGVAPADRPARPQLDAGHRGAQPMTLNGDMCGPPRDAGPSRARGAGRRVTGLLLLLVATGPLVAARAVRRERRGCRRRLGVTVLAVGILLAGAEPEGCPPERRPPPVVTPGSPLAMRSARTTRCHLTLGLAALLRPVPVGRRGRLYAALSAVAGGLAVLAVFGGDASRVEGGLPALADAGLIAGAGRRERRPPAIGELAEIEEEGESSGRAPGFALLLTLVGLVVMTAGGAAAVNGASRLVRELGPDRHRRRPDPARARHDRRAVRAGADRGEA